MQGAYHGLDNPGGQRVVRGAHKTINEKKKGKNRFIREDEPQSDRDNGR